MERGKLILIILLVLLAVGVAAWWFRPGDLQVTPDARREIDRAKRR